MKHDGMAISYAYPPLSRGPEHGGTPDRHVPAKKIWKQYGNTAKFKGVHGSFSGSASTESLRVDAEAFMRSVLHDSVRNVREADDAVDLDPLFMLDEEIESYAVSDGWDWHYLLSVMMHPTETDELDAGHLAGFEFGGSFASLAAQMNTHGLGMAYVATCVGMALEADFWFSELGIDAGMLDEWENTLDAEADLCAAGMVPPGLGIAATDGIKEIREDLVVKMV